MTPEFKQRLVDNFYVALRSWSSLVVTVGSMLQAWWMGHTEAEIAAWMSAHPLLAPFTPNIPTITFALWALARVWPQLSLVKPDEKREAANVLAKTLDDLFARGAVIAAPPPEQPEPAQTEMHVDITTAAPREVAPHPAAQVKWTTPATGLSTSDVFALLKKLAPALDDRTIVAEIKKRALPQ